MIFSRIFLAGAMAAVCCAHVSQAWAQSEGAQTADSDDEKTAPTDPPPVLPKEHHAWARFQPGAWKAYRLFTETLDEQGKVASVNVTTTIKSLERVGDADYTLNVEDTVEVLGRKQVGDPQSISYNLFDQANGETTNVRKVENETISIEGQSIECQTWVVESTGGERTRTTTILYSDDRCPYTLRRATSTVPVKGETPSSTVVSQVTAFDMPFKFGGDVLTTSHIRTERRSPKGTKTTIAVHCEKVPGGVVYQTSKELDADGRLIRRSTLELLDYNPDRSRRPPRSRRVRGRRSDVDLGDEREIAARIESREPATDSDRPR